MSEFDRLPDIKRSMRLTEIENLLDTDACKIFKCTREDGGQIFSFKIIFTTRLICLTGDCGDLLLRPNWDYTLPWLRGSVNDVNYLLEKIPYELKDSYTEYCAEYGKNAAKEAFKVIDEAKDNDNIALVTYHQYVDELESFCDKCDEVRSVKEFYDEYINFIENIKLDSRDVFEGVNVIQYTESTVYKVAQLQEFCRLYEERFIKNAQNI